MIHSDRLVYITYTQTHNIVTINKYHAVAKRLASANIALSIANKPSISSVKKLLDNLLIPLSFCQSELSDGWLLTSDDNRYA